LPISKRRLLARVPHRGAAAFRGYLAEKSRTKIVGDLYWTLEMCPVLFAMRSYATVWQFFAMGKYGTRGGEAIFDRAGAAILNRLAWAEISGFRA
jgi:hypothetical protein